MTESCGIEERGKNKIEQRCSRPSDIIDLIMIVNWHHNSHRYILPECFITCYLLHIAGLWRHLCRGSPASPTRRSDLDSVHVSAQNITSTVRALVFGRHQFFGTSEHYGKANGSLLSDE